jgi:hypothetical protein
VNSGGCRGMRRYFLDQQLNHQENGLMAKVNQRSSPMVVVS